MASWLALLLALGTPLQESDPALRARLREILDTETDRRGVNPEFEKWKRDLWKEERRPAPPERREPPPPPSPAVPALGNIFLWGTIAVCAAGLAFAAWTLMARDRAAAAAAGGVSSPTASGAATGPVDALKKSPDAWLADARAALARGDRRAAIRLILLAVLALLHRNRRLAYEKSMTNRECLRAFRGPDEQRRVLAGVVGLFESAWYGGLAVGEKDCALALESARDLGTEAPDGGTAR